MTTFAERYPQDKRSKDAIFNAGLYLATLGRFDESKRANWSLIEGEGGFFS